MNYAATSTEKATNMAEQVKLKNRRVRVGRHENGIYLGFMRLRENEYDSGSLLSTVTEKTVTTELVITKAAAVSLYYLLQKELKLSDLVEFEKDSGQKIKC